MIEPVSGVLQLILDLGFIPPVISEFYIKERQTVAKGEVLTTFVDYFRKKLAYRSAIARLKSLRHRVKMKKLGLVFWSKEYSRQRELMASNATTKSRKDDVECNYLKAVENVKAMHSDI